MVQNLTPVIPESLQPYASGDFYEVVDRFAAMSLDAAVATMPEAKLYSRYRDNEPAVDAALYRPKEFDPTHAVLIPYPFANGHEPHMHIRNHVTQQVLGGNVQVIGFPNNTTSETHSWLNEEQQALVALGDARPLAAAILGVVAALRIETIDILGYSQGAFIGAAVLHLAVERGEIDVKHILLAESPNLINRTKGRLKKDFTGTGLFPFVKAVNDSGIPALAETQATNSVRSAGRLAAKMLRVQKASKDPVNQALFEGMTHGNLLQLLENTEDAKGRGKASLGTQLTIARAIKSKITPLCFDYEFIARHIAAQDINFEGYGHEAGDNVPGVFALSAKAAVTDTEKAA